MGGITISNRGPIILVMNQYALSGEGNTIHSLPQMEWYNVDVNDKSMKVGRSPTARTIFEHASLRME